MNTTETITLDIRNWLVGGVTYLCPDGHENQRHIAEMNTQTRYSLTRGCGTSTCPNGRALLVDRVHLVVYAAVEGTAA